MIQITCETLGKPLPPDLNAMLQPGKKLRIFFFEGNVNNREIEIRGIVDNLVVYRFWLRSKGRWVHVIEDPYLFWSYWKNGNLLKR